MLEFFKRSIKNKYFILLILFGMLPIIILGFISNRVFAGILENELNKSMTQTIEKASVNIGLLIQRMSDLSEFLEQSSDVVDSISNNSKPSEPEKAQKSTNAVLRDVSLFFNFPIHIFIIDNQGNTYSNINISAMEQKSIAKTVFNDPEYRVPVKYDDKIYWLGICKNLLSGYDSKNIYYLVRNIINNGEYLGTMYIGTSDYILFRALNNIKISDHSRIVVFDHNSNLTMEIPGSLAVNNNEKNEMEKLARQESKPRFVDISGSSYSTTFYKTGFNWDITLITPVKSIRDKLSSINKVTLTFTILSVLCITIILFLVNSNFVKPIIYLSNLMRLARKGDLEIRSELKNIDEIGVLSEGFNKLLADFKKMLEKIQMDEKRKKELEFKVLQSQIKPHFLYNTLNSIRWMAEMNNESRVGDSIVSLVRMIEYTTAGGEKLVTLKEEVQYIREYLDLQTLRYWNRFEAIYDISEEISSYKMPRLALQPVVENCLMHGLGNRGKLLITISGRLEEGKIVFRISDNGSGIDTEILGRLRSKLSEKEETEGKGIGLMNVNQRIKLEFGIDYGIEIDSFPNGGTEVTITIPALP